MVRSCRGWPEWPWECSVARTRWTSLVWGTERKHRHLPQDSFSHSAPTGGLWQQGHGTQAPPYPDISRSLVHTKMRVIQALSKPFPTGIRSFLQGSGLPMMLTEVGIMSISGQGEVQQTGCGPLRAVLCWITATRTWRHTVSPGPIS